MKASILALVLSLCSAFAASACPTQGNDWISGKWKCKSQNPENTDTELHLTLKNDNGVAVLRMKGDTEGKDLILDGPLDEKNEHVLIDEGKSDHYNKISYSAVCSNNKKEILVSFRTTFDTATQFILNYDFSAGEDTNHLNIYVTSDREIDGGKQDNHLSCLKIN